MMRKAEQKVNKTIRRKSRLDSSKSFDTIFVHKPDCEWPYKHTKAEFEAFHCNKLVWEYSTDHYTHRSNYQMYEHYLKSVGASAGIGMLAYGFGCCDMNVEEDV